MPCPFCGIDDARIVDDLYVDCAACDAEGPPALSREAAIAKWNTRFSVARQSDSRRAPAPAETQFDSAATDQVITASYLRSIVADVEIPMIFIIILIFFAPLREPEMELRPWPDGETLTLRV